MKNVCLLSLLFFASLVCLQFVATCTVQAAYCDGVTCVEPTTWEVTLRDINMALASGDWQGALSDIAANYGCYDLAIMISSL